MELRQQFPRLGHSDQYRPMLGRSHHASELQALLGALTIFFYFGASHKISPLRARNAESSKWFQAELKNSPVAASHAREYKSIGNFATP